jgi:hypothetical protein
MNFIRVSGANAFLRTMNYFTDMNHPPTMERQLGKSNLNLKKVDNYTEDEFNHSLSNVTKNSENGKTVCKVNVSLSALFLHVDQGCVVNGNYTPFASPTVNVRSVDQSWVTKIVTKVEKYKQWDILGKESFAVLGYKNQPKAQKGNDSHVHDESETGIKYRDCLDHDEKSRQTILEKRANTFTIKDLSTQCFERVS